MTEPTKNQLWCPCCEEFRCKDGVERLPLTGRPICTACGEHLEAKEVALMYKCVSCEKWVRPADALSCGEHSADHICRTCEGFEPAKCYKCCKCKQHFTRAQVTDVGLSGRKFKCRECIRPVPAKPRYSLIPWTLRYVADVFTFGATKHGDFGYAERTDYKRELDAVLRHVYAHREGEYLDVESGKPHLAHAAARCLILMHMNEQLHEEAKRPVEPTKDPR